jgi:hypothetical protein
MLVSTLSTTPNGSAAGEESRASQEKPNDSQKGQSGETERERSKQINMNITTPNQHLLSISIDPPLDALLGKLL